MAGAPVYPQAVYDILGQPPPQPTAEQKADPENNRGVLEAWRVWNAQALDTVDQLRESGKSLKDLGMSNATGQGKWLFDRDAAISAYGQGGADANYLMDWVHGRMRKRSDPANSRSWVPIPKEYYDERQQAERGVAKFGSRENMLGHQGLKQMMHYGHLNQDPTTGLYFNIGHGNPNDPSTWQWVDGNNHPVGTPPASMFNNILQANAKQVSGAGGTGAVAQSGQPGYYDQIFGAPYQNPTTPTPTPTPTQTPTPITGNLGAPLAAPLPSNNLGAPPTVSTPTLSPTGQSLAPQTWSKTLADPNKDGKVTIQEILDGITDPTRKKMATDYLDQMAATGGAPDYNYLSRIGTSVNAGTDIPKLGLGTTNAISAPTTGVVTPFTSSPSTLSQNPSNAGMGASAASNSNPAYQSPNNQPKQYNQSPILQKRKQVSFGL